MYSPAEDHMEPKLLGCRGESSSTDQFSGSMGSFVGKSRHVFGSMCPMFSGVHPRTHKPKMIGPSKRRSRASRG